MRCLSCCPGAPLPPKLITKDIDFLLGNSKIDFTLSLTESILQYGLYGNIFFSSESSFQSFFHIFWLVSCLKNFPPWIQQYSCTISGTPESTLPISWKYVTEDASYVVMSFYFVLTSIFAPPGKQSSDQKLHPLPELLLPGCKTPPTLLWPVWRPSCQCWPLHLGWNTTSPR